MKKKRELFDELDKSLSTLSVDKKKLLKRYLELKEIFGNRFIVRFLLPFSLNIRLMKK